MLHDPRARRLCFVAGHVQSTAMGLLIHPITLVFEGGRTHIGVQPWVDRGSVAAEEARSHEPEASRTATPAHDANNIPPARNGPAAPRKDAVGVYPAEILTLFGKLVLGLRRTDAHLARRWQRLARDGEALGYDRLVHPVSALANEFATKLTPQAGNRTAPTS